MHQNEYQTQSSRFARAGWSFIELLSVLVVLAISAVIVIPYAASGASAAGQSATRFLVTDMLAAQMDAVATQGFRRLHFFTDGSGWCVVVLDSSELNDPFNPATAIYAEDAIESQGQNQQSIVNFVQDKRYKDITIENPNFDNGSLNVTFDPTGGIVTSEGMPSLGGSVEITSGDFRWEITVAPLTGKVSVSETTGEIQ